MVWLDEVTLLICGIIQWFKVVSKKIAEGDVKSLDGLVTQDILPSLQRAVTLMSLSQREQIAVEIQDIYFSFPYQVRYLLFLLQI